MSTPFILIIIFIIFALYSVLITKLYTSTVEPTYKRFLTSVLIYIAALQFTMDTVKLVAYVLHKLAN